jgi:hypothetical protein
MNNTIFTIQGTNVEVKLLSAATTSAKAIIKNEIATRFFVAVLVDEKLHDGRIKMGSKLAPFRFITVAICDGECRVANYILNRYNDGFGLNPLSLKDCTSNTDAIFTSGLGLSFLAKLERAKSKSNTSLANTVYYNLREHQTEFVMMWGSSPYVCDLTV